eukprot:12115242-Alexandrium_andersonii.AAC.1
MSKYRWLRNNDKQRSITLGKAAPGGNLVCSCGQRTGPLQGRRSQILVLACVRACGSSWWGET